jgi:hypothetical protein
MTEKYENVRLSTGALSRRSSIMAQRPPSIAFKATEQKILAIHDHHPTQPINRKENPKLQFVKEEPPQMSQDSTPDTLQNSSSPSLDNRRRQPHQKSSRPTSIPISGLHNRRRTMNLYEQHEMGVL